MQTNNRQRIYLDNAATSWPKKKEIIEAVAGYLGDCGAVAGRGQYASARTADRWVHMARIELAKAVNASNPSQVALCNSGTHALNCLLAGLLKHGDRVVTSQLEHNSVLRPLTTLVEERGLELVTVEHDEHSCVSIDQTRALCQQKPQNEGAGTWLVLTHASNVTGRVQDLASISDIARQSNFRLLVDCSQTLGYQPIDFSGLQIDGIAAAAHKGLGALSGSGFIVLAEELQTQLMPIMSGGTGVRSESVRAEVKWPMSVEVGCHSMAAVVSMAVAAKEYNANQTTALTSWRPIFAKLLAGLEAHEDITVVNALSFMADPEIAFHVPVLSCRSAQLDIHELCTLLDEEYAIETRAGLHCAALVHSSLGTSDLGGTLRLSIGHQTTEAEVDAVLQALEEIHDA